MVYFNVNTEYFMGFIPFILQALEPEPPVLPGIGGRMTSEPD